MGCPQGGKEAPPPFSARHTGRVPGDEELFELLEDLEAQAEAMQHQERAAEVADRARSEYGTVTLDQRLMASLGRRLEVDVPALGRVRGELERVGPGWFQLGSGPSGTAWVRTATVTGLRGASDRALPDVAWSPVDRLGFSSVLRRLGDEQEQVVVLLTDGGRHAGLVGRVGEDFVEVLVSRTGGTEVVLVPLAQVTAVRGQRPG
jgi:hypothetical protein